jgi:hypothetical protein
MKTEADFSSFTNGQPRKVATVCTQTKDNIYNATEWH